nr:DoxX family protein [uncultured Dyadobacter sp.]
MSFNSLKPDLNSASLLLRLFLALVLFPHGAQKFLGWFGGFGFEGSMQYFTGQVGLPWIVGFLVIMIEFFAPLALALGVAVRFSAAAIASVMTGVIVTTFHDHFFMDWFGSQQTEGMEFFLLAIGIAVALIFTGGGTYSLDRLLKRTAPTTL